VKKAIPAMAPTGYRNDKYEERGNKQIYQTWKIWFDKKMVDTMLTGLYSAPAVRKMATEEWASECLMVKKW